jgi:hypothetical protein
MTRKIVWFVTLLLHLFAQSFAAAERQRKLWSVLLSAVLSGAVAGLRGLRDIKKRTLPLIRRNRFLQTRVI